MKKTDNETSTSKSKANILRMFLLMFVFFLYLLIGAAIFSHLEGNYEEKLFDHIYQFIGDFYYEHKDCMDYHDLEDFVREIAETTIKGVHNFRNNSVKRWDLANSFYFSSTVVTTIGYGKMSPNTIAGRHVCVLYALLGIPITAMLLSEIGSLCKNKLIKLSFVITRKIKLCLKSEMLSSILTWIIILLFTYAFLILLPALAFAYMEGWKYHDAHYFCFISLTTIGFGDRVAASNPDAGFYASSITRWMYEIVTVIYLVFGLSVLAIMFNTFQSCGQQEIKKINSLQNRTKSMFINVRTSLSGGENVDEGTIEHISEAYPNTAFQPHELVFPDKNFPVDPNADYGTFSVTGEDDDHLHQCLKEAARIKGSSNALNEASLNRDTSIHPR